MSNTTSGMAGGGTAGKRTISNRRSDIEMTESVEIHMYTRDKVLVFGVTNTKN